MCTDDEHPGADCLCMANTSRARHVATAAVDPTRGHNELGPQFVDLVAYDLLSDDREDAGCCHLSRDTHHYQHQPCLPAALGVFDLSHPQQVCGCAARHLEDRASLAE